MVKSRECVHCRPLSSQSKCVLEQNHTLLTTYPMTDVKFIYTNVFKGAKHCYGCKHNSSLLGDTLFHMPFPTSNAMSYQLSNTQRKPLYPSPKKKGRIAFYMLFGRPLCRYVGCYLDLHLLQLILRY